MEASDDDDDDDDGVGAEAEVGGTVSKPIGGGSR